MDWLSVVLYLIPVVLCGYWLLTRERQTPRLPEATARVLAALEKLGTDPTKPAAVTFLLSFENREAAEHAVRDLPPTWATVITELPEQHRWTCRATATMLPAPDELSARAQELEALAIRHRGEYEGLATGA